MGALFRMRFVDHVETFRQDDGGECIKLIYALITEDFAPTAPHFDFRDSAPVPFPWLESFFAGTREALLAPRRIREMVLTEGLRNVRSLAVQSDEGYRVWQRFEEADDETRRDYKRLLDELRSPPFPVSSNHKLFARSVSDLYRSLDDLVNGLHEMLGPAFSAVAAQLYAGISVELGKLHGAEREACKRIMDALIEVQRDAFAVTSMRLPLTGDLGLPGVIPAATAVVAMSVANQPKPDRFREFLERKRDQFQRDADKNKAEIARTVRNTPRGLWEALTGGPKRCEACGNTLKKTYYSWAREGESDIRVCPECNRRFEAERSRRALRG